MKGRAIPYSKRERAWLEANHTLSIREYHERFCEAFGRKDVAASNLNAFRKRQGWKTGRTGQFEKGMAALNKGKRMPFNANSAATQFKPGARSGRAQALYRPIGTERLSKEGYLERKIHDGMPLQSRWRAVHLLRWEEIHGPLAKGMALKCLDGNKANTDPSNWEEIPRAILPRLNGGRMKTRLAFDAAPAELRPTILATAKLEHRARTLRGSRKP